MKLIYKLTIIINDNLEWDYIFDNYAVIENFLDNYKSEFNNDKTRWRWGSLPRICVNEDIKGRIFNMFVIG